MWVNERARVCMCACVHARVFVWRACICVPWMSMHVCLRARISVHFRVRPQNPSTGEDHPSRRFQYNPGHPIAPDSLHVALIGLALSWAFNLTHSDIHHVQVVNLTQSDIYHVQVVNLTQSDIDHVQVVNLTQSDINHILFFLGITRGVMVYIHGNRLYMYNDILPIRNTLILT
jgi:hypothetical protein